MEEKYVSPSGCVYARFNDKVEMRVELKWFEPDDDSWIGQGFVRLSSELSFMWAVLEDAAEDWMIHQSLEPDDPNSQKYIDAVRRLHQRFIIDYVEDFLAERS